MSLSASLASLRASSLNPAGNVVSDSMETENVMGFYYANVFAPKNNVDQK